MKDLPRLSALERLILEMLSSGREMYGLEMVKASGGQLKRGTIYVTLMRMEDEKGFVQSREAESELGPPKRAYRITGHGSRALAAWQMAGATFAGSKP